MDENPVKFNLAFKDFDFFLDPHHFGEFAVELCGAHNVVVNPVVVTSSRFCHEQTVIPKAFFFEPVFGDFPVVFCARSEERNNMPLFEPLIHDFQCVGKWLAGFHALGFFVGHVLGDGSVDIDEVVLDVTGQLRAEFVTGFIGYMV